MLECSACAQHSNLPVTQACVTSAGGYDDWSKDGCAEEACTGASLTGGQLLQSHNSEGSERRQPDAGLVRSCRFFGCTMS